MIKIEKTIRITLIISCICLNIFNIDNTSSYASSFSLDSDVQTGADMVQNAVNTNEQNIDNNLNDNVLTPEDFLQESEIPNPGVNENGETEILTAEDFLDESATLEEFENRVLQRMLDVVSFIQNITKPLCIIFFIICALGVLMSIIFGTNKHKSFILGLILSVVVYVGVIFAPDIVLFFADWLSF